VPCAPVLTRFRGDQTPACPGDGTRQGIRPSAGRPTAPDPRLPPRFSKTPTEIRRGAPLLGEHSVEVAVGIGLLPGADRRSRRQRPRQGSGGSRGDDRLLLLADAEWLEGQHHAGGVRARIPHGPGQYRQKATSSNRNSSRSARNNRIAGRSSITTTRTGPLPIFESGPILLHLSERSGQFMPAGQAGRVRKSWKWLFWQVGNLGPMAGQLSHFVNYAQGEHTYSHQRYANEYNRCLGVFGAATGRPRIHRWRILDRRT